MAKLELDNLQHKIHQRAEIPSYPGFVVTTDDLLKANVATASYLALMPGEGPLTRAAIADQIMMLIRLADMLGYKASEIVIDHFNATSSHHKVDIHIPR